jgi:hypothetical protein
MRVLVISDERPTADSFAEALRQSGHQVLALYSAIEAVEHAEELAFDVAILGTPWWPSGESLAKTLRKLMPSCKVVRCAERRWAEFVSALDAEFNCLAMDKKRGRPVKRASQPRHTFKADELLEQLDEIRVQKVLDSQFGSQWNVTPLFIRRRKVA